MKGCKETADIASDPDQPDTPTRSVFDMERSKFGIGIRKLHKSMFDTLNGVRSKAMQRRARLFPLDDERRRMFFVLCSLFLLRKISRSSGCLPHGFRAPGLLFHMERTFLSSPPASPLPSPSRNQCRAERRNKTAI